MGGTTQEERNELYKSYPDFRGESAPHGICGYSSQIYHDSKWGHTTHKWFEKPCGNLAMAGVFTEEGRTLDVMSCVPKRIRAKHLVIGDITHGVADLEAQTRGEVVKIAKGRNQMEIPAMRIELEGVQRTKQQSLLHSSDDIDRMIERAFEEIDTAEGAGTGIKIVDSILMLSNAIKNIASNCGQQYTIEKALRRNGNERE